MELLNVDEAISCIESAIEGSKIVNFKTEVNPDGVKVNFSFQLELGGKVVPCEGHVDKLRQPKELQDVIKNIQQKLAIS